jgi:hypothetical protein
MLKPYSDGDFHPLPPTGRLEQDIVRKETANVYVFQIHMTMVEGHTNLCVRKQFFFVFR